MALGKNLGHKYEDFIFKTLKEKGVYPKHFTHIGKMGGPDSMFVHHGTINLIEVKNGLGADFGQKMLNWSEEKGWNWAVKDDTTELYSTMGALAHLRKRGLKL